MNTKRNITTEHRPDPVTDWLLTGDPAIRWQTLRDISETSLNVIDSARRLVAEQGWGARLLSLQEDNGQWGRGIYSPKWTSTTYTMLLLRSFGLSPDHPRAAKACALLLENGFYRDQGINFFGSLKHSETCVTGMIVALLAYFRFPDDRLDQLVEFLLDQQLKDGGWNCQSFQGATHSSFHTTINVLEGLEEYGRSGADLLDDVQVAGARGREFLLQHRLYRSHRTGKVVNPAMTRFSFPPRWHYDVLRVLDYFQEADAGFDERLNDAIGIVLHRQRSDGRWILQNRYPGRTHFEMEQVGEASRWNTLRALRVLKWWKRMICEIQEQEKNGF